MTLHNISFVLTVHMLTAQSKQNDIPGLSPQARYVISTPTEVDFGNVDDAASDGRT